MSEFNLKPSVRYGHFYNIAVGDVVVFKGAPLTVTKVWKNGVFITESYTDDVFGFQPARTFQPSGYLRGQGDSWNRSYAYWPKEGETVETLKEKWLAKKAAQKSEAQKRADAAAARREAALEANKVGLADALLNGNVNEPGDAAEFLKLQMVDSYGRKYTLFVTHGPDTSAWSKHDESYAYVIEGAVGYRESRSGEKPERVTLGMAHGPNLAAALANFVVGQF